MSSKVTTSKDSGWAEAWRWRTVVVSANYATSSAETVLASTKTDRGSQRWGELKWSWRKVGRTARVVDEPLEWGTVARLGHAFQADSRQTASLLGWLGSSASRAAPRAFAGQEGCRNGQDRRLNSDGRETVRVRRERWMGFCEIFVFCFLFFFNNNNIHKLLPIIQDIK